MNRAAEYATPLIAAAAHGGSGQQVKLLLEAGADVNAEAGGKTALMVALERNNFPLAHFLRRAGAVDKPRKLTQGKESRH